uniref:TRP C-terminal domain-containing protein n=1 Tax=Globisporangium ultimum (strain ATCC 200006 / CBS 805.95 / DAOM BR144) TaxID=431595 RepID=K3X021_GLOUD
MPTDAASLLSKTSASFHDFVRYSSVAFAGISVMLLLFFHYVSLDGALFWTNPLWSPNTWEFLLYVGYLQQMASLSQLTLLKTPYFLWDYTDSFAWTNFLLQDSTPDSTSRRLETIVLGGVVSFADRIGIFESKILYHAVTGFAIVFFVLLAIFLIGAILAKRQAEKQSSGEFSTSVHRLRSTSIRTLGLCVLIWYFSLFPLSLYASFEISMEVTASAVSNALSLALIALVVVCFGILAYSGRVIMHKSMAELQQFENMATWGSLYAEYTYRSRMFFIIGAVVQITTGILIGTMDADPMQLIVVMGIQVLYLVAVFILSPFAENVVLYFTYALGIVKIVNFGLAFSFLNSNTMSATDRNKVADAFIGINSIVILVWFVRQLVVFSTYIRVWMQRDDKEDPHRRNEESTTKYE